jgi:hypothetical protein
LIYNATLVRLDPPAPGLPGPEVAVRCALAPLSSAQQRLSEEAGWGATSVAYLPARKVPSPRPIVGGHALLQPDDDTDALRFPIVQVIQRLGHTLSHMQVYLGPAES